MPEVTEKLVDVHEAARLLTELGFKVSHKTLNRLRGDGGGPVFRYAGRRVVYIKSELLAWMQSSVTQPVRSTIDKNNALKDRRDLRDSHWRRDP